LERRQGPSPGGWACPGCREQAAAAAAVESPHRSSTFVFLGIRALDCTLVLYPPTIPASFSVPLPAAAPAPALHVAFASGGRLRPCCKLFYLSLYAPHLHASAARLCTLLLVPSRSLLPPHPPPGGSPACGAVSCTLLQPCCTAKTSSDYLQWLGAHVCTLSSLPASPTPHLQHEQERTVSNQGDPMRQRLAT
jgi:hypothetical protein